MAVKGLSVYTHQGEDYTINDPNVAGEFSASTPYEKNSYCYYQGTLYRFDVYHAAGAWNSSQVTAVLVTEEMKEVGDRFDAIENRLDRAVEASAENISGDDYRILFTSVTT